MLTKIAVLYKLDYVCRNVLSKPKGGENGRVPYKVETINDHVKNKHCEL